MRKKILVVDDEQGIRLSLEKIFTKEGFDVLTATNGDDAFRLVRKGGIDLIVTDIRMAGMDGMELLKVSKSVSPHTEVIMITGYAAVETAVDSLKEGACDYLTKPFKKADILGAVHKAIERQTLSMDQPGDQTRGTREGPLVETSSPRMKEVVDLVRQVAPSQATVLILGKTGSGKEVIADMIHRLSPRAERPMIKVNCAAIPETLIESELFGYEKGAFTGASSKRQGRFEAADQGTIFLDEIGDVPAAVQVKLLRILQEGTFEHLGSNEGISVDTRIIAATNRDLSGMVQKGTFREDLYWRLNVININLPDLKERKEDIPSLVQHFIARYAKKNSKPIDGIESGAMGILLNHDWPGNVRELENIIERSVVMDKNAVIDKDDLPFELSNTEYSMGSVTIHMGTPLDEVEKILMEQTLKYTRGDKALASRLLGVSTRTLYRKLDRDDS
ncbi:MAG: sigma-54 dependent transcriptional regulator [Thermodesulfobacteriota bacterium]|nr:sigma-54 dependent transcriptional regulator [Thermodesulfobacteriota bacterium]